jgi:hypothetical protein
MITQMYASMLKRAGLAVPLLLLAASTPAMAAEEYAPIQVQQCEVWTAPDARDSATIDIAFANQRAIPAVAVDVTATWGDGSQSQTFHNVGRFTQNARIDRQYIDRTWTGFYETTAPATCQVARVRYADGSVWAYSADQQHAAR